MAQELSFTNVIEGAARLPFVRIDRTEFLTKNLRNLCTSAQLQKAIAMGTLHAGIPIEKLDKLANDVINNETIKVTVVSTAAGIPGGLAMAATIPADITQFYGHVIRVAQQLAYIYGWNDMFIDSSNLDASTESQMILFIGVMSGVEAASKAVTKLFGDVAVRSISKKIAAQALTKTWYYPIVKKVALLLGQRMTKDIFAKGVSKAVPLIGGAISGGMTYSTFKPMAHKLRKHLSELAHMSPTEFAKYEAREAIVVDGLDLIIDTDQVDVSFNEKDLNGWTCSCSTINYDQFCPKCGNAKPLKQEPLVCHQCGWEPADQSLLPNFCQSCGTGFRLATYEDTQAISIP